MTPEDMTPEGSTDEKRTSGIEELGAFPKFTERESQDFVRARDLIGSIVAHYSARIHRETDPVTVRRLTREQRKYWTQMQSLSVRDHEEISRVISEYPQILRTAREDGESRGDNDAREDGE
ncbi:hypothetical protein [Streptomyces sp. R41]|uniref:Uncharacterized protein n=1 Tax=Streptomyces sp. R41 TaxID=3238632 RepID=A0AB39RJE5_9ACTN